MTPIHDHINSGNAMIAIRRVGPEYRVTMRIRTTEEEANALRDAHGGTVSQAVDGAWWWNLRQSRVFDLLHENFHLLKGAGKIRADIVLQLRDSINANQRDNPGRALPDDVVAFREGLINEMKKINKR